jgi:hypothetical protein
VPSGEPGPDPGAVAGGAVAGGAVAGGSVGGGAVGATVVSGARVGTTAVVVDVAVGAGGDVVEDAVSVSRSIAWTGGGLAGTAWRVASTMLAVAAATRSRPDVKVSRCIVG